MKKLFALVLTLALVFAIAAPAMAAGMGFDAPAAPAATTYENITFAVTQLNYDAAGAMAGYYTAADGTYYALYNPTTGVVGGVPVRFAIDVTIPDTDLMKDYNAADFAGALLTIKLANITTVVGNIAGTTKVAAGAATPAVVTEVEASKEYTVPVPALSNAGSTTIKLMVTGTVTASAKDATATVSIPNAQTADVDFVRNGKLYNATVAGNVVTVSNTVSLAAVAFTRNATTMKIESMTVTPDGAAPAAVTLVDGAANFAGVAAADIPAYQAALNEIFGVLGFTWNNTFTLGYFSNANVDSLAAQIVAPKTATWKAFTASLTVTDGSSVPNTGDNMSVIGFVMVGLAVLATAAVVVKKVRA